jgi:hypothetical protein
VVSATRPCQPLSWRSGRFPALPYLRPGSVSLPYSFGKTKSPKIILAEHACTRYNYPCPGSFLLAGFEVTTIGRIWGDHRGSGCARTVDAEPFVFIWVGRSKYFLDTRRSTPAMMLTGRTFGGNPEPDSIERPPSNGNDLLTFSRSVATPFFFLLFLITNSRSKEKSEPVSSFATGQRLRFGMPFEI